jgi:hypothetical protein
MTTITIKHRATGIMLFQGDYADQRAAIEDAVSTGASLDGADLRGANLCNAMLDGAQWRHVSLHGANLTGANLSEALIDHCDMRNTTLFGTCFCESTVQDTDLSGALCGGTDIAAARLERVLFSTLSALQMNFRDTAVIEACAFHDEAAGQTALFARPPVYVGGLDQPVIVLDSHVRIGPHMIPRRVWLSIANDNWPGPATERPDSLVYNFVRRHARLLEAVAGTRIFDI